MLPESKNSPNKEKVTLTLNPTLLKEVDRWSKEEKIKSRSAAIEKLIIQWKLAREKKRLEKETEAYYLSLTKAEKEENKEWVEFTGRQAMGRWKE